MTHIEELEMKVRIREREVAELKEQNAEQRKRILELEDFLAMVHRSLRFESVNDMKTIVNRVPELETQVAELERKLADAEDASKDLNSAANHWHSKLLSAEAHIGVQRDALQRIDRLDFTNMSCARRIANEALASSPDPTLKDRVVEVLRESVVLIDQIDAGTWEQCPIDVSKLQRGVLNLLTELREQT